MTVPRPTPTPRYVLWELTRACNLRCRHCLTRAGAAASDELSEPEALAVCDALAAAGVGAVALLGGEPLVRPDWERIAARLAAGGVPTSLATNGVLFDEAVARRARRAGVNQVVVSLDGRPATHDRIRGPGTFRRAIAALATATRLGFPHRMAITSVHRGNVDDLPAVLEVVLEAAPGATWTINFTSVRHDARMPVDERADAGVFLRVAVFVAEARRRLRGRLDVTGAHDLGYHSRCFPDLHGFRWSGCPAGLETFGITAGGRVKACLALPDELAEADVRGADLAALWRDPERFPWNRRFRPADLRGACAGCEHGAKCRGGCLEFDLTMTGEAHHAPFCLHRSEREDR